MGTNANGRSSALSAVVALTGIVSVCAAAGYLYLSGLSTASKKDRVRERSSKKGDVIENAFNLLEGKAQSSTACPVPVTRTEIPALPPNVAIGTQSISIEEKRLQPQRNEKLPEDAMLLNTTAQEVALEFVQENLLSFDALPKETWRDYEQVEMTKSMNDFFIIKQGEEDHDAEIDAAEDSYTFQELNPRAQAAEAGTISKGFTPLNNTDGIIEPLDSSATKDDHTLCDEKDDLMPIIQDDIQYQKTESPPASQEPDSNESAPLSQKAKKKKNKKKRN